MPNKKPLLPCSGCRALRRSGNQLPRCELGYAIDASVCVPCEPCPRPLLYLDYIELRREYGQEHGAQNEGGQ